MSALPLHRHFADASRLVFGCMGLGGPWQARHQPLTADDRRQAAAAVESALAAGITVFDHADIYTAGKAESVFGELLQQNRGLRERLILQSKCGIRFADADGPDRYDLSAQWIVRSVESSLQRLGTDYLDILMLHRPDPLMDADEIAEALLRLQASGKVRAFGVSNMHQHQIGYLQSVLETPLVVNQMPLDLARTDWLDQGVTVANEAGGELAFTPGLLEHCRTQGIQLQAWGSLSQGQFGGRLPDDAPARVRDTAALVGQLAAEYQVSREALVLAWLMRHPARIQPVIGTTNAQRIRACSEAESIALSRGHWYQLYIAARGAPLP